MKRFTLALSILCTLPSLAHARDWYVDPWASGGNGSSQVPTLGRALDAASDGDTIWLSSGVHEAPLWRSVQLDGLTIVGTDASTILDARGRNRGLSIDGHGTTLVGIDFYGNSAGKQVVLYGKGQHVLDCRFRTGGGLFVMNGNVTVEDTVFDPAVHNALDIADAGGLQSEILRSTFTYGDSPGPTVAVTRSSVLIEGSTFERVGGYNRLPVEIYDARDVRLIGNTFLAGDEDAVRARAVDTFVATNNVFEGSMLELIAVADAKVDHNTFLADDISPYGVWIDATWSKNPTPAQVRNNLFVGVGGGSRAPIAAEARRTEVAIGGNVFWNQPYMVDVDRLAYLTPLSSNLMSGAGLSFDTTWRPRVNHGFDLNGMVITDNPSVQQDRNGASRGADAWAGAAEPRRLTAVRGTYMPTSQARSRVK